MTAQSDSPDDFEQLLRRVGGGSQQAARQLHAMFGTRVLRAVRRRLPRPLRAKFDSQDFVQETWLAFWKKYRDRYFPSHQAFAAFLSRVAEGLVIATVRQRLQREKYDLNREQQIADELVNPGLPDVRQPTPSKVLMGREEWHHFLTQQPPVLRRLLILYRQGHDRDAIAEELHLSRRTVDRFLEKLLEAAAKGAPS